MLRRRTASEWALLRESAPDASTFGEHSLHHPAVRWTRTCPSHAGPPGNLRPSDVRNTQSQWCARSRLRASSRDEGTRGPAHKRKRGSPCAKLGRAGSGAVHGSYGRLESSYATGLPILTRSGYWPDTTRHPYWNCCDDRDVSIHRPNPRPSTPGARRLRSANRVRDPG